MSSAILGASRPTDIFVVRHSEVHNPRDILYGRLPRFGLSDNGRSQAEATARFLSTRRLAAVYTSPLLRARQTAAILSRYHAHVPVRISARLMEVRTSYQGQPNRILKPGFSFYDPIRSTDDETMSDIAARMLIFLRHVARRHDGGSVVAVSHADPIAVTRLALDSLPFDNEHLHSTVYPARSSVTQLMLRPGRPLEIAYFNVAHSSS